MTAPCGRSTSSALERAGQPGGERTGGSRCRPRGPCGVVGAELARGDGDDPRHTQGRSRVGADPVPIDRGRGGLPARQRRREGADRRRRHTRTPRPSPRRRYRRSGPWSSTAATESPGQLRWDDVLGDAATPASESRVDATRTMIYTSGTTGRPKGAVRKVAGAANQFGGLLELLGWDELDPLIFLTTGPLYHSGPSGFALAGPAGRRHRRHPTPLRRRGLAAPGRHPPGVGDVLGADADTADLRAARRGQGPLRRVVDAHDDRQRRAVDHDAQAGVPRRTSRPTRCGRCTARPSCRCAPRWRLPISSASPDRAACPRPASRSGSTTTTASSSTPRAYRASSTPDLRDCSRPTTGPTTATSTITATDSRRSATSRIATTRATSTSATARRT